MGARPRPTADALSTTEGSADKEEVARAIAGPPEEGMGTGTVKQITQKECCAVCGIQVLTANNKHWLNGYFTQKSWQPFSLI